MDDVVFERCGGLGLITLNRPGALNALTSGMCAAVRNRLQDWEQDEAIKVVAVVGAGDKAFCAGGDVVKVANSYKAGTDEWQDFFLNEYRMNIAIDAFSKPYVALVDGITMGGGVGISIPGDYWVATEKTVFAMPETGLGLFPDVGGGWFLPRLPGAAGMYLALTGARLKAADLHALRIASHVTTSDQIDALVMALASVSSGADVADVLARFHCTPDLAPINTDLPRIDLHYGKESVDAIIASLSTSDDDWCAKQRDILSTKSPTSLKVSFEQLMRGKEMPNFAANMAMEYRLVNHIMEGADFFEGVRAILIDKDQAPVWSPKSLDAVSAEHVAAHFAPLPAGEELLDRMDES